MAMVNMNNLLNGKDSRWLQLEVCREFQRNKCTRPDTECKFAHPPANVEVQNGRVTACYDSIKIKKKVYEFSMKNLDDNKIQFYWIPAYIGIQGNESVNGLAKNGTNIPPTNSPKITIPFTDIVVKEGLVKGVNYFEHFHDERKKPWYAGKNVHSCCDN
ncbi:Protein muscleblind [Dufourea novaeangliae]|uniref:Protein muscleblind n=1 Tax=Dufourea novaeangliae TaxID=178035 RepID=A0A154PKL1_DUFNO|nr:Protein muscleblind [Dufourea novaeangliae]